MDSHLALAISPLTLPNGEMPQDSGQRPSAPALHILPSGDLSQPPDITTRI